MALSEKITFIGSGQMAQALARGMIRAALVRGEQLSFHDPSKAAAEQFLEAAPGAKQFPTNAQAAEQAEVILLAVKPQTTPRILEELSEVISEKQLVISIIAGMTIERLSNGLGAKRIVRVMPNTPCLVGKGAAGYALGEGADENDGELVGAILGSVGKAFKMEEPLLDAVTGLSGSGPAFVFMFIEAMADGGVRMGLPRSTAAELAAQTVLGAAELVNVSGEHPAALKDRVASPAGTTIAGIQSLEDRNFRAAVIAAVEAATNRSLELSRIK